MTKYQHIVEEVMGQLGQPVLTATEKVWRDGQGRKM
jgi:hypothetical protein